MRGKWGKKGKEEEGRRGEGRSRIAEENKRREQARRDGRYPRKIISFSMKRLYLISAQLKRSEAGREEATGWDRSRYLRWREGGRCRGCCRYWCPTERQREVRVIGRRREYLTEKRGYRWCSSVRLGRGRRRLLGRVEREEFGEEGGAVSCWVLTQGEEERSRRYELWQFQVLR